MAFRHPALASSLSGFTKVSIGLAPLLLLLACGGDPADPIGPTPVPGNTVISVVSGDQQVGEVGTELGQLLTIRVTANGTPLPSTPVSWAALESGSIVGDATTDPSGYATARWTLPTATGTARVRVLLPHGATIAPAAFEATALPGAPAEIRHDVPRWATTDAPLVIVGVYDRFGNGVPGADVVLTLRRDGTTVHQQSRHTTSAGTAGGPVPLEDASHTPRFGNFQMQVSTPGLPVLDLPVTRVHTVRGFAEPCCFPGVPYIVWGPNPVTVTAGTAVHWGFSTAGHPIEVVGVGPVPGGTPEIGDFRTLRFDTPGTFQFRCIAHPNDYTESGTVVVTP